MSNDWNDIDKLFNNKLLGDVPNGDPVVPWAGIEKRVIRANFYKFSLTTFNIYYLSILFALASTVGVLTYVTINDKALLRDKDAVIQQYTDGTEKNVIIIDSVQQKVDTLINEKFIDTCANVLNTKSNCKVDKGNKKPNENQLQKEKEVMTFDTVVHITVNKQVVSKQVVVKRKKQLNDSIVFK